MKRRKTLDHIRALTDFRGAASEQRVENALTQLQKEEKIYSFHKAQTWGELDRRGIDFQIYFVPNWLINLQVKSSLFRKELHEQNSKDKIPCIAVLQGMTDEELLQELTQVLIKAVEGVRASLLEV
jgi:hypothetical protein